MCSYLPLYEHEERKPATESSLDGENFAVAADDAAAAPAGNEFRPRAGGTEHDATTVANRVRHTEAFDADAMSDTDLVQSAISAVERTAVVPAGKVNPVVRDGWLILDGAVEAPYQKRAVVEAIRHLNGIRGFSDNLLIESDLIARDVGQKIAEVFAFSALLTSHRISVTVHDHKVILSGMARSIAERDEAEAAAWAVPGVAAVINRIEVPT
jgi:osmotically-inducible protein OsmY